MRFLTSACGTRQVRRRARLRCDPPPHCEASSQDFRFGTPRAQRRRQGPEVSRGQHLRTWSKAAAIPPPGRAVRSNPTRNGCSPEKPAPAEANGYVPSSRAATLPASALQKGGEGR